MTVLICPTCRGSLTVVLGAVAHVVWCPHCRNPLTVPAFQVGPPVIVPAAEAPAPELEFRDDRSKRRGRASGSSWAWIAFGVTALVLVAVLVLFASGALRDPERHQMDSCYSDLTDNINELSRRMDAIGEGPMTEDGMMRSQVYEKISRRLSAVRTKLWKDYSAKYGADPKYLPPKDRAEPNPMRLHYPTD